MEIKEKIKAFVYIQGGKTLCICKRDKKGCNRPCEPDIVERDKFAGWERTLYQNKYGGCSFPSDSVKSKKNRKGENH